MKIVFFGNPEFAATSLEHLNTFNNISIELIKNASRQFWIWH